MSDQTIIWDSGNPGFVPLLKLVPENEVRHLIGRGFPDSSEITICSSDGCDPEVPRVTIAKGNAEPFATVEFFISKQPLVNYAKHAAGILGPKKLRHVTGPTATAIIYDPGIPLSHQLDYF